MGIGFVFIAWFIIDMVVGIVLSFYLAAVVALLSRSVPAQTRMKRIYLAAMTPYLFIFYFFGAMIIYVIWCWGVRGVDPGLADTMDLPLKNGYRFVMIDTSEQAKIVKPGVQGFWFTHLNKQGELLFGKSTAINNGDFLYGPTTGGLNRRPLRDPSLLQHGSGNYFLLDTSTDELLRFESRELLRAELEAQNPKITKELLTALSFSNRNRWKWPDAAAALLIGGIPATVILCLIWRFSALQYRRRRLLLVIAAPLAILLYLSLAYLFYASWCIWVRRVDAGFVGRAHVSIERGYVLELEKDDQAFLMKNGMKILGVSSLGKNNALLYGESGEEYFFINLKTDAMQWFGTKQDLLNELSQWGVDKAPSGTNQESIKLLSAANFYFWSRWKLVDLLAVLATFGLPPVALFFIAAWRQGKYFHLIWGKPAIGTPEADNPV